MALIPHPFGIRTRDEIRKIAADVAPAIARLLCEARTADNPNRPQVRAPSENTPRHLRPPEQLLASQSIGRTGPASSLKPLLNLCLGIHRKLVQNLKSA